MTPDHDNHDLGYEAEATDGSTLRERLAALCHEQWSGWMAYLFSRLTTGGMDQFYRGPACVIEATDQIRWSRQMRTPYAELPEHEKESDRKEADRILALLKAERIATANTSSTPYDELRETVVRLCLESRTYPSDKQGPFLRDALLTLVDPLMVITQRIREHGPLHITGNTIMEG